MAASRRSVALNYFGQNWESYPQHFYKRKLSSGNYCEPFWDAALAAVAAPCIRPWYMVIRQHDNYNRFTYLIPQKDTAFFISTLLGYAK